MDGFVGRAAKFYLGILAVCMCLLTLSGSAAAAPVPATYAGWGSVTPAGINNYAYSWKWNDTTRAWSWDYYYAGTAVYLSPFSNGWTWTWTQAKGWQAMHTEDLSIPNSVMPFVTRNGADLRAGTSRFVVYGFNDSADGGANLYLAKPNLYTQAAMIEHFQAAKKLGANVYRTHLQLFDFIGKDAAGNLVTKPAAMTAFKTMLREAEAQKLYLDIVGNNVWIEGAAPAWYDALTYRQRWMVQGFFFKELAKVGVSSPAVFAYELTNEPTISTDAAKSWYGGEMGGWHFTQVIARGVPSADVMAVGREWMTSLRNSIRSADTKHLVTVGGLPFNGGPFSPQNQAAVLDMTSVHIYPKGTDVASAVNLAKAFGTQGLPMFVGETSLFTSSEATEREFLLQQKQYSDGVVSFYDGRDPSTYTAVTIPEAIGQSNTKLFVALRAQLIS